MKSTRDLLDHGYRIALLDIRDLLDLDTADAEKIAVVRNYIHRYLEREKR